MSLDKLKFLRRLDTSKAMEGFPRFDKVFVEGTLQSVSEDRKTTKKGEMLVISYKWKLAEPITAINGQKVAAGRTITDEQWINEDDDDSVNRANVKLKHVLMAIRGIEPNDDEAKERLEIDDDDLDGKAVLYFTFTPNKDDPESGQGFQNISYYTPKGAKERQERIAAKEAAGEAPVSEDKSKATNGRRGRRG